MKKINYRNCPLSLEDQFYFENDDKYEAERVAVLAPFPDEGGLMRIVAITDSYGTYPAAQEMYYDWQLHEDDGQWLYRGHQNECPPGRDDVLKQMTAGWSKEGIVKLARWCRNRAFEHAWNAAAYAAYAAAYHRQWLEIFEWIAAHEKRFKVVTK